jgi:hypothetical protein
MISLFRLNGLKLGGFYSEKVVQAEKKIRGGNKKYPVTTLNIQMLFLVTKERPGVSGALEAVVRKLLGY